MKKNYLKSIIIFVLSFLLSSVIFKDWDNFKAGLYGKPPVENKK